VNNQDTGNLMHRLVSKLEFNPRPPVWFHTGVSAPLVSFFSRCFAQSRNISFSATATALFPQFLPATPLLSGKIPSLPSASNRCDFVVLFLLFPEASWLDKLIKNWRFFRRGRALRYADQAILSKRCGSWGSTAFMDLFSLTDVDFFFL